MKAPRIGINGFNRVARLITRNALCSIDEGPMVVAINQPRATPAYIAYLLKYSSTHGMYKGKIKVTGNCLEFGCEKIFLFNQCDANKAKWRDAGVEYIVDCSGTYTTIEKAGELVKGCVKKAIIGAASTDVPMFVAGVNLDQYMAKTPIISNGSSTLNCLAPLAKIINDNYCIAEGLMTTVRAVTDKQKPVDNANAGSGREGRDCLQNIIPTSSDIAETICKVLPELNGKLDGLTFKMRLPSVSLVDLTVRLENPPACFKILTGKIRDACEETMRGILGYTEDEIVSSDLKKDGHSGIFDAKASMALCPDFVKLIAWYDNDYAYAMRLIELINHVYEKDNEPPN